MGLNLEYIDGQTPIDEDEKEGFLIKSVSTRGELDEFEQANIEEAVEWTMKNRFTREDLLTEDFLLRVHYKMFGKVWRWAGKKRKSNKNIGADKFLISTEIKYLLDDCNYWIDHQVFDGDEISIRFSHRIVKIHIFPNGNGRHSRLIGDILVSNLFNKPVFTWGRANLSKMGDVRKRYLEAIYLADAGDLSKLITFARS